MKCPKCQGRLREIDSSEGVTLDFCSSCKGLWFDRGEVADFFDLSCDIPEYEFARASSHPTEHACPKCPGTLVEFQYSAKEHLILDVCSQCGGIWFDAGEVPVLNRLSARLESPQSRILKSFVRLKKKDYDLLGVG